MKTTQSDLQKSKHQSVRLSVVVPAFNEEGNLEKLYLELSKVLTVLGMSWEIVFADDGSRDNTWQTIQILHGKDQRVRGVRLSRNFGHQYALLAGLSNATGDAVVTMDADLQHPPALILQLVEEWQKGSKIVKTVRIGTEKTSRFKRMTSSIYYRIFTYLSGVEIRNGMADFRLLDRQVLEDILKFKEEGLFLRGIVEWVGYTSSVVAFDCGSRFSGESRYTLRKMVKLAWNGVSSFSLVPLRLVVIIGFISSGIALLGVLYAVISKFLVEGTVSGWASSVAIISFLFGVLFFVLGVLGEYVGRVLVEVRERPRFLISETLGVGPAPGASKPVSVEESDVVRK